MFLLFLPFPPHTSTTAHGTPPHRQVPPSEVPQGFLFSSSGAAFQERPQPAEISRGTGIILPGRPCALAYCSICIACVVPANVRIQVSSLSHIVSSFFQLLFCIPDAGCRLSHCCISSSANSRRACAAIRTSSSVSTWEKLNLTAPCSRVPSASCINGAQCAPLRTAIP